MKICTFKEEKIEKAGIIYKEHIIDIALLSDTLSNLGKEEFPAIWSVVELIQKWEKVKKMIKVGEKTFGNKFLPIFSVKNQSLAHQWEEKVKSYALAKTILRMQKKQEAASRKRQFFLVNLQIAQ